MSFTQLISPNPHISCVPGWCLQYVRQTFGLPARYGSATEAWNASASKHRNRTYPKGVWFAIWYHLDTNVHGHVALVAPDGTVYSTSSLKYTPYHHPNVAHLEAYYKRYGMTLTYLGWTEDVAGFPVIKKSEEEDDLMATFEQRQELIRELFSYKFTKPDGSQTDLGALVAWRDANDAAIVQGSASEVFNRPLPWAGFDGSGPTPERNSTTLGGQVGWLDAQVNGLAAQNAALLEVVKQLAIKQGVVVDYDQIANAVAKAVNDEAARRLAK